MKRNRITSLLLGLVMTVFTVFGGMDGYVIKAAEANEKIIVYVAVEGKNAGGAAVQVTKTPIRVEKGTKAVTAIQTVLDNSQYKGKYTISKTSWGESLDEINGLTTYSEGNNWFYWSFYANGSYTDVGIGSYELKNNDKISLIYSYENSNTEASCFQDDVTKNPTGSAITEKIANAKNQQSVLAKAIYDKQFANKVPGIEDVNGLYSVFSMVRAGADYKEFYQAVIEKVGRQLGELAKNKWTSDENGNVITEDTILESGYAAQNYAKIALAVTALGKDASNVNGFNLIEKLVNRSVYEKSSIYSREAMVLFAIDSKKYEIPTGASYVTREELVNVAAANAKEQIDVAVEWETVDSVAMAIQPLVPYVASDEAVKAVCDETVQLLESMQAENGYFGDSYTPNNPWTLAQVMTTAGMFDLDVLEEKDGSDFIKNGITVFDNANAFVGETVAENLMAFQPEQLLRGLNSCIRSLEKQPSLYDMTMDSFDTGVEFKPVEEAPLEKTEALSVKEKNVVIAAGKSKSVSFTVKKAANAGQAEEIKVTSSNKKVATANVKDNKVTITVPKTATVGKSATITISSGTKKATIKVQVKNPVTSIKAAKKTVTIKKGSTQKLTFTMKSKNKAYLPTDTLSVTAKGAVKCTKTTVGKTKVVITIKGVKKGTTNVTIKMGTKSAKVKVQVEK